MDVSRCGFGVGRQRRDHPHQGGRCLDERQLTAHGPDADRHGGDFVVAGEHERAEPETEPALSRGGAVRLERDRPQHPEVAEAFLDDRGGFRTFGVLHDHFQLEDVPDLHRLGDDFGNGGVGRFRARLAGSAGGGCRQQAAECGQRERESHRRRFSRMRKNFRRGAS